MSSARVVLALALGGWALQADAAASAPGTLAASLGLEPGVTTGDQVVRRLGRPSAAFDAGERFRNPRFGRGYSYAGERAPKGTREVQVVLSSADLVVELHIFPLRPLGPAEIGRRFKGTYSVRAIADGRHAWVYPDGLVVVFRPDGRAVDALSFTLHRAPDVGDEIPWPSRTALHGRKR